MATKKRHEEPQPESSRNAIIVLALGALVVAALVVWALTRTVEPTETAPVASSTGFSEQLPPPSVTQPSTATQPSIDTQPSAPPLAVTQTTLPPISQPPLPPATQTAQGENASVARISAEDLREHARAQTVTILDVRDDASYAQGHIPGALHIAFARIEGEMETLPKNKPIVTYCT